MCYSNKQRGKFSLNLNLNVFFIFYWANTDQRSFCSRLRLRWSTQALVAWDACCASKQCDLKPTGCVRWAWFSLSPLITIRTKTPQVSFAVETSLSLCWCLREFIVCMQRWVYGERMAQVSYFLCCCHFISILCLKMARQDHRMDCIAMKSRI